jgi:hypothetical protein
MLGERTRVQSATPSSLTSVSGFSEGAEPCMRGACAPQNEDTYLYSCSLTLVNFATVPALAVTSARNFHSLPGSMTSV